MIGRIMPTWVASALESTPISRWVKFASAPMGNVTGRDVEHLTAAGQLTITVPDAICEILTEVGRLEEL